MKHIILAVAALITLFRLINDTSKVFSLVQHRKATPALATVILIISTAMEATLGYAVAVAW